MRYMGKGKIRLYFGAMAIGAIAYILYMFIDFIDVKYNIPPSVTAVEQIIEERGVMASWHPEGIDALVIGGSNAMYGLSAEILSDQLGISFLNLTLLSEGHNEKNYYYFLQNTLSEVERDNVKTIVYSPFIFHTPADSMINNWDKNLSGQTTEASTSLLPNRAILNLLMNLDAGKQPSVHRVSGKYGDFDFTQFNCQHSVNVDDTRTRHTRSAVTETLMRRLDLYQPLFKNANLVVVVPSLFGPNQQLEEADVSSFRKVVEGAGGTFIVQPAISSENLVCDAAHHPNKLGREVRTLDLVERLEPYISD